MAVLRRGNEDQAWDGVWNVATHVDSLGWTAEFQIPLSQMRYGAGREHTFGIMLLRDIYRYSERLSWPLLRSSKVGWVSQFGHVSGLDDLDAPRRLEAAPYVVTKNATRIENNAFTHASSATLGGDLKYRVASNLTLDADGEPRLRAGGERPGPCSTSQRTRASSTSGGPSSWRGAACFDSTSLHGRERLQHRRGAVLLASHRAHARARGCLWRHHTQQPSTILTAGKLTGRLGNGLTVGLLDAVTQRVTGRGDTTFEPGANYAVIRARQDLRGGESNVGAMLTAVNRSLDSWSSPYMTRSAYAGAVDFTHRFPGKRYEVGGSLDVSRVDGSRQVIAGLQRMPCTTTSAPTGGSRWTRRARASGDPMRRSALRRSAATCCSSPNYSRRSPGFEINDIGYLQQADQQAWSTWAGFFDRHKRAFYQRFQWNVNCGSTGRPNGFADRGGVQHQHAHDPEEQA